jgi:hypothetical protein
LAGVTGTAPDEQAEATNATPTASVAER